MRGKVIAAAALALFALPASVLPAAAQDGTPAAGPDFAAVRKVVNARCHFCHTAIPQEDGLNAASQPPKGIKFDSLADWQKFAPLIQDAAVTTQRMPPGNATHMTEAERALLGRWFAAGAPVPASNQP